MNDDFDSLSVQKFYDDFLHSRMLSYRLNGNERIERASELVLRYVKSDARVLEIGCGIGIVTERVSNAIPNGYIWACDLSPENIWYAKKTIPKSNIDFFVLDIINQFQSLVERINEPINVVVMVDVLEHIPLSYHFKLMQDLSQLLASDALIVLTYPSPMYQRYLRKQNTQELQPIDEIIELNHLLNIAVELKLELIFYSLIYIWYSNQYVHCVLQKTYDGMLSPTTSSKPHVFNRLGFHFQTLFRRLFLLPRLKRKYVKSVFKKL